MTAQTLFHRHFAPVYLALMALLGASLGWLAVVAFGGWLATEVRVPGPAAEGPVTTLVERLPLSDYEVIMARNLFDPSARGAGFSAKAETANGAETASAAPAQPRTDLVLVGTVVAGELSLALIRDGRETIVYRLDDEVPGGTLVDQIARSTVVLRNRDGSRHSTLLLEPAIASPAAASPAAGTTGSVAPGAAGDRYNIRALGENKWQIPRTTADEARGNFNELLKQARMEPRVVGGETQGFVIRMIRPNTFLDILGLQRGDVLMEINGIKLDSPEKALQVFQQLREARNISIGLLRNDQPVTFEYEID